MVRLLWAMRRLTSVGALWDFAALLANASAASFARKSVSVTLLPSDLCLLAASCTLQCDGIQDKPVRVVSLVKCVEYVIPYSHTDSVGSCSPSPAVAQLVDIAHAVGDHLTSVHRVSQHDPQGPGFCSGDGAHPRR